MSQILRYSIVLLLWSTGVGTANLVSAQQRPSEPGLPAQGPRDAGPRDPRHGFEGPPGPRGGRPDGPPPGKRGDRPPLGGPRGDGPPPDGPPLDGPPHGRFGLQLEMRRMEQLKDLDPEMYALDKSDRELERETLELAEQLRRAPQEKREALRSQLTEAVSKHFDVRQSRRELHLKRLAEELEKLRASFELRNEVRDQIIGKRVSELVGEEDDLAF